MSSRTWEYVRKTHCKDCPYRTQRDCYYKACGQEQWHKWMEEARDYLKRRAYGEG